MKISTFIKQLDDILKPKILIDYVCSRKVPECSNNFTSNHHSFKRFYSPTKELNSPTYQHAWFFFISPNFNHIKSFFKILIIYKFNNNNKMFAYYLFSRYVNQFYYRYPKDILLDFLLVFAILIGYAYFYYKNDVKALLITFFILDCFCFSLWYYFTD